MSDLLFTPPVAVLDNTRNMDFSSYNGEGTLLKKVQVRSLEIMVEIDRICRRHGIDYWLNFGSLLGAVRHQGFIPWDDDIDVSIAYKDLDRFRNACIMDLSDNFVYQDWTTDKNYFLDSVVKVRDKKSYFPIEVYKGFKEQGLLVDIIPLERIPGYTYKKIIQRINKYPYLLKKELSIYGKSDYALWGTLINPFSEGIKWLAHKASSISKGKKWMINYTFITRNYERLSFDEEDIFPLRDAMFEGYTFKVPNNPIKILEIIYGPDCLEIPDDSLRITHSPNVEFFE